MLRLQNVDVEICEGRQFHRVSRWSADARPLESNLTPLACKTARGSLVRVGIGATGRALLSRVPTSMWWLLITSATSE